MLNSIYNETMIVKYYVMKAATLLGKFNPLSARVALI